MYQDIETPDLDPNQVKDHGLDVLTAYHRGLSCRLIYQLGVEVNAFPGRAAFPEWWDPVRFVPLLEGYSRVEPYMGAMTLLDDEQGTMWHDSLGNEVVFPWKPIPAESLGGTRPFTDVVIVKKAPANEPLKPGRIYFRDKKK
jgi:hypothetical protein